MIKHVEQRKLQIDHDFRWVERVASLLDNKFSIGRFRFGLDPVLNFFPVVGQLLTFGVSILLVLVMFRNGVSSKAATKMLLNVIYDAIVGSIPLFGNIFDFLSKANQRNVKILKEYYYEDKHQGSAKGILTAIFSVLLLFYILVCYIVWIVGKWVINLF